jgi:glycosyltransferase involved in cell wall biosynthesis
MKPVEIQKELKEHNDEEYLKLNKSNNDNKNTEKNLNFLKYLIYILLFLFFIFILFINKFTNIKIIDIKKYKKYINDCKHFKKYNRISINKENPFLSICLSALNMEKYIQQNLLSIINQSFQDFEIIIVNDYSTDNTINILKRIQSEDERIKIINHSKNLGVYTSRVEAILNSKGKFVILMDPDDMFLNEDLFQDLYSLNSQFNLDIIEFCVYQQIDGTRNIFYPDNHFESHYHNFGKKIIYQPDLSNLLYYSPGTNELSHTICRNIWNKMINRQIFFDMYIYIGIDYFKEFIITSDDMLMNIIIYQFAKNYSNIELPGYLYNIRKISMSRGNGGEELKIIRTINHFFYFKIFYRYIKDYHKDRNYLFYEMKDLNHYILYIKDLNITKYISLEIDFLNEVKNDGFCSDIFKNYLNDLLIYFLKTT